ncbi:MAG: M14 family zinc carboxypeptidase, partial [Ignavibacteria bacterium]|nr:M14 family zinc carboxypeptidase [Ignavibacteria bacterium]
MKTTKTIFSLVVLLNLLSFAQQIPLEKSNYTKLTSYAQLTEYIYELDKSSDLLRVEVLGKSIENRNVYVLKFSNTEFGKDNHKIKLLIFAQQHGNEQSGKEASLLLAKELMKSENQYLFDRIDLALIPQMNPDGSEKNKRRNGNDCLLYTS